MFNDMDNLINNFYNQADEFIEKRKKEKYDLDYWKSKNVKILDEKPDGWIKNEGATTAPRGYNWYNNGKSRFGGEYENALVNEETSKFQVM